MIFLIGIWPADIMGIVTDGVPKREVVNRAIVALLLGGILIVITGYSSDGIQSPNRRA